MNAAVKTQWVQDLRSGNYEQGKDHLRNETGYCCLGVLCDRQYVQTSKAFWSKEEFVYWLLLKDDTQALKSLLPVVDENNEDQSCDLLFSEQVTLAKLNDGDGPTNTGRKSFAEIADWIEENVEVTE